ncbi:hypothetical protein ABWU89_03295 [Paenibacillus amylolyticus]
MRKTFTSVVLAMIFVLVSVTQVFAATETSVTGGPNDYPKFSTLVDGQNLYGRFTLNLRDGGGGIEATVQESTSGGGWKDIAFLSLNITSETNTTTTNVYMARGKQYRIYISFIGMGGTAYLRGY